MEYDEIVEANKTASDVLGRFITFMASLAFIFSLVIAAFSFVLPIFTIPIEMGPNGEIINTHVLHTFIYCLVIQLTFVCVAVIVLGLIRRVDYTKHNIRTWLWSYVVIMSIMIAVNLAVFLHTLVKE